MPLVYFAPLSCGVSNDGSAFGTVSIHPLGVRECCIHTGVRGAFVFCRVSPLQFVATPHRHKTAAPMRFVAVLLL